MSARKRLLLAVVACVPLMGLRPACADLVITVGSVSLQAGTTGYVPVYISSDDGTKIGQTVPNFLITPTGATVTQLDFANSPAPSSDPTFSNSNYIFYNNSHDVLNSIPFGNSDTTNYTNDTFDNAGDSAVAPQDVTVSSDGTMLLVELPITGITGVSPVAGDTFSISLLTTGRDASSFSFVDGPEAFSTDFTSDSGTVTITAPSATPTPNVLPGGLAGMSLVAGLALWNRRRRTA